MKLKLKDVIIAIIALIFAYLIIEFLWRLMFFAIRIVVILIAAYILYLILKKLL
ncbi:MAG TPA: hypothetical protein VJJ51_04750 [Candidatus Methanoperedens sp.]|nr:hypothetical protein [Candidatus Methanoperedens sp.]